MSPLQLPNDAGQPALWTADQAGQALLTRATATTVFDPCRLEATDRNL